MLKETKNNTGGNSKPERCSHQALTVTCRRLIIAAKMYLHKHINRESLSRWTRAPRVTIYINFHEYYTIVEEKLKPGKFPTISISQTRFSITCKQIIHTKKSLKFKKTTEICFMNFFHCIHGRVNCLYLP